MLALILLELVVYNKKYTKVFYDRLWGMFKKTDIYSNLISYCKHGIAQNKMNENQLTYCHPIQVPFPTI